jgi:hypothetical protein
LRGSHQAEHAVRADQDARTAEALATALVACIADPKAFRSGRDADAITSCPHRYGILARMPKNKESEFEKLARLIKEEGDDIRADLRDQIGGLRTEVHDQIGNVRLEIGGLRKEMHEGFAAINRRLDQIIQMQLDEHAARIKKLETAVFSK